MCKFSMFIIAVCFFCLFIDTIYQSPRGYTRNIQYGEKGVFLGSRSLSYFLGVENTSSLEGFTNRSPSDEDLCK